MDDPARHSIALTGALVAFNSGRKTAPVNISSKGRSFGYAELADRWEYLVNAPDGSRGYSPLATLFNEMGTGFPVGTAELDTSVSDSEEFPRWNLVIHGTSLSLY
jgi:hypothetical protein